MSQDDPQREIAKLRGLLERERVSRREAESIAEQATRDLYQRIDSINQARADAEQAKEAVEQHAKDLQSSQAATVNMMRDISAARENLASQADELKRANADLKDTRRATLNMMNDIEAARRQLAEKAEELGQSNTDLEQFAYVASHDLQEPLRAVVGFCQLLRKRYQGQLDETGDDYISDIVDGGTRMQTLISDLLAYSRVGRKGGQFQTVDCAQVVEGALSRLKTSIEECGAAVHYEGLPAVAADRTQIGQLFQNLIGNGIKYRGERPTEIHIAAKPNDEGWLFSVRDNGLGIESEFLDRIFVIFQRLHTRDEYSGTGIGLAICKRIVDRHGGRIWAESKVGEGSVFYFTIPR